MARSNLECLGVIIDQYHFLGANCFPITITVLQLNISAFLSTKPFQANSFHSVVPFPYNSGIGP